MQALILLPFTCKVIAVPFELDPMHSENRKEVGAETERCVDLDGQGGATPEEVGGSGDHRKWPCSLPLWLRSHVLCSQPFSHPTVNRDQDADRRAPGLEM